MENYNKYIENAEFNLQKGDRRKAIYFYSKAGEITKDQAKKLICKNIIDNLQNQLVSDIVDESMLNDLLEEIENEL